MHQSPNHRMPVRALRPILATKIFLSAPSPNHRMPVRALRHSFLRRGVLVGTVSESSNARQGIKTEHRMVAPSEQPPGPNHRMPVRALRHTFGNVDPRGKLRQNHRMPVRALRLKTAKVFFQIFRSESSNARQGIKTVLFRDGYILLLGPNHRMPVRALRQCQE